MPRNECHTPLLGVTGLNESTNIAASVRQKLLNLAANSGDDPNLLWNRYAIERLLYRLSISDFKDRFVLKGAVLFSVWSDAPHRPTMDLDLEGFGENSDAWAASVFKQVCRIQNDGDGLSFDADSVHAETIRGGMEYQGRRIKLIAYLGKARIPIQVDIGFGDTIIPAPEWIEFPVLLDMPPPIIRIYPMATVVAEKLHAIVTLGIANSRMKDFYDLYILMRDNAFEYTTLSVATKGTFDRRKTPLPCEAPFALTDAFARDSQKRTQWRAFMRKINGTGISHPELDGVILALRQFACPVFGIEEDKQALKSWPPNGPWQGEV